MPGRMMKKRTAEKENNNLITADNNNIADCFAFAEAAYPPATASGAGRKRLKRGLFIIFQLPL